MDVFSHGLWAGAGAIAAKRKWNIPVRFRNAFFWGVFSDVFAFGPLFAYLQWHQLIGQPIPFPRPGITELEPVSESAARLFSLTPHLYQLSHSLIIFAVVFALVIFFWKKPPWALGGWLLHILMDIPTHSYQFYPTPFLWPLSSYRFDGFSWGQWWFILLDYTLLAAVFSYFYLTRKKQNNPS